MEGRRRAEYARCIRAARDSITIDRPASLLSTNIGPVRDKAARFARFLEPRAISLGYV